MHIRPTLFTIIFAALLVLLSLETAADTEQEHRRSISEIGTQIKQISRNLNANKALLKTAQDRLFETEKKLSELRKKIDQTNAQITLKQQKIKALDTQLQAAKDSQHANRQALKNLLLARFKSGDQDYIKRVLNQENAYAVGRLNNYYGYFSTALRARFADLEEQIRVARQLHTEQQQAIAELVLQREQQQELQAQHQDAQQQRAKSVARLNKKVGASQEKLEKLKKDRARLNELLQQIAKQAAELKRIEQQRAAERARQQARNDKSAAPVVRTLVKGGFIKQKGRLQRPVSGNTKTRFGNRLAESGMRSEGMFFSTEGSQPVRSIFRGQVLFADFLKGYGLLIIVDHGDDHISLYGHNKLLYKRVGDTVDTNEVIAMSGVTGGLKSTGLYFEIREKATPINPAVWFSKL